jgi:LacI family transcriptional regulator
MKNASSHRPRIWVYADHDQYRPRTGGILNYARTVQDWDIVWFPKWNDITPASLKQALSTPPDGILSAIQEPELLRVLQKAGCPVVALTDIPASYGIPMIACDHEAVGAMAANHFLSNGFRSFACVYFPDHRRRMEGFAARLARKGHALDSDYQVEAMHKDIEPFSAWLKALPHPTAIFCCNDVVGWHTSQCAHRARLDVPSQVALLGVDDDELFCKMAHPHLSSIRLTGETVGYEAALHLDRLMHGSPAEKKKVPPTLLLPPVDVVVRASSDLVAIQDRDVARAVQAIRAHYTEPIGVDDLLQGIPVSKRQMERRFQQQMGCGILDLLRQTRCQRARDLLADSHLPITEIAFLSGFTSIANFNRAFLELSGKTPSAWRNTLRARQTAVAVSTHGQRLK